MELRLRSKKKPFIEKIAKYVGVKNDQKQKLFLNLLQVTKHKKIISRKIQQIMKKELKTEATSNGVFKVYFE